MVGLPLSERSTGFFTGNDSSDKKSEVRFGKYGQSYIYLSTYTVIGHKVELFSIFWQNESSTLWNTTLKLLFNSLFMNKSSYLLCYGADPSECVQSRLIISTRILDPSFYILFQKFVCSMES